MGNCTPNKSINYEKPTTMQPEGESSSEHSEIETRKIGKNRNFYQSKSSKPGRQGKDIRKSGETYKLVHHPVQKTPEHQESVEQMNKESTILAKTDKNKYLIQSGFSIDNNELHRSAPCQ